MAQEAGQLEPASFTRVEMVMMNVVM